MPMPLPAYVGEAWPLAQLEVLQNLGSHISCSELRLFCERSPLTKFRSSAMQQYKARVSVD